MKTLSKSDVKELINLDLYNEEVLEQMESQEDDFEEGRFRFIHKDEIDKIQQDELSSDEYILGCFNAEFLCNILPISYDAIKKMQECEAFEAVGEIIIGGGHLEEVQEQYASADGYGQHFNSYDGNEYEVGEYLVFQTN